MNQTQGEIVIPAVCTLRQLIFIYQDSLDFELGLRTISCIVSFIIMLVCSVFDLPHETVITQTA